MGVYEVILSRRSIRAYKREPIMRENLEKILESAKWAPSAGNRQPWHFVVVLDEQIKEKLVPACRNQGFIRDAACVVVGLADLERSPKWAIVDTTIALEHIVLEATELGYGTCWIGAFDEAEVKKILNIPDKYKVVALIPIGVPAESPPPRPRKPLKEIVSLNTFGNPW
ncbi:MAG: nitroreductase family protein [Ignisphaera sp.]|uniref:Nitroreductase n=1 Tax=Ignisphaera aggregans TaxID=334771 RepID=A0A7C4NNG0_9CREN